MNPITEAEAAKLVCPFVRGNAAAFTPGHASDTGVGCIGRACLLWLPVPNQATEDIVVNGPQMAALLGQEVVRNEEPDHSSRVGVSIGAICQRYAAKAWPNQKSTLLQHRGHWIASHTGSWVEGLWFTFRVAKESDSGTCGASR